MNLQRPLISPTAGFRVSASCLTGHTCATSIPNQRIWSRSWYRTFWRGFGAMSVAFGSAAPLPASAIRTEVTRWPTLEDALGSEQLKILDPLEWYGEPAELNGEEIIGRWLSEEDRALADGYNGLRITGNTSFVPKEGWTRLIEYERTLSERLQERRILAFCSYSLRTCQAVDMLEVVRSHHAALDRSGEYWQMFTPREVQGRPRGE